MNNLNNIHVKCGLSLSEDDHVLVLKHRSHVIREYPISGAMSINLIHKDADDYIAKEVDGWYWDRR